MFGDKKGKQARQQKIKDYFIHIYPNDISIIELARILNISHTTIIRDLPDLNAQGFYLEEYNNRLKWTNLRYD